MGKKNIRQLRRAKTLRGTLTDAERKLWLNLRAHRLLGEKFRRQHPIGPYIVDFVHFGGRLVIEVDGSQHLDNAADAQRDAWLHSQGLRVLRFWNNDVLSNTEAILQKILQELERPLSPNPSPASGEGNKSSSDS